MNQEKKLSKQSHLNVHAFIKQNKMILPALMFAMFSNLITFADVHIRHIYCDWTLIPAVHDSKHFLVFICQDSPYIRWGTEKVPEYWELWNTTATEKKN